MSTFDLCPIFFALVPYNYQVKDSLFLLFKLVQLHVKIEYYFLNEYAALNIDIENEWYEIIMQ